MSTLKSINIIHPSGSTNNIVNDASGNITVGNNATVTGGLTVTGTLTGSTGVMNIGSGQLYKDASGNVGVGTASPTSKFDVASSADTISTIRSTGTIQSSVLLLTGRQSSTDENWNVISAGSGLATGSLRFTRGTWTGSPSAFIDSSSNFAFNSGYGSAAVAYGCRAWVNYNGNTPAIRASGGITSVTKNSAGNYTLNFSFTMPDANYAPVFGTNSWTTTDPGGDRNVKIVTNGTNIGNGTASLMSTTQLQIIEGNTAAGTDHVYTCVAIFR
jgi:hypothetical protein